LLAIAPLPLNARAAHIRSDKPKRERAVRLDRLRPVVNVAAIPLAVRNAAAAYGKTFPAYDKAWAAYEKARAAYSKAWAAYAEAYAAYVKARDAYEKACADHRAEIEALHALECPGCPWDGKTLFPDKEPKP